MVGLGAGVTVEFAVGTGVDVSSVGRSSSSKAVGSPWETTTKENTNKRNGRHMVIRVLMNQSMMIEGKVRESIYIVQTHAGATQRTNMIDSSPLITHATAKLSWQSFGVCLIVASVFTGAS